MQKDNEYFLNILRENTGFSPAHRWVQFAREHNFKRVKCQKLNRCPDCKNENLTTFGQYIYYSNIFHIKYCPDCGLFFSDTLLDHNIILKHFESSYKDEYYFSEQRKHIFRYVTQLVDKNTPLNGQVLDIGGGKGHLLNMLKNIRPDLEVKLNDISKNSCAFCRENFGIDSVCCNIPDLSGLKGNYNTILLIDVIYYEPLLHDMFETVNKLLSPERGTLIIRIPNKLELIKVFQLKLNLLGSAAKKFFQSRVKYFNPEHIYIFSKAYLKRKLIKLGFDNISFIPSPLLYEGQKEEDTGRQILFKAAKIINRLSFGCSVLTPSMIIIAGKSQSVKRAGRDRKPARKLELPKKRKAATPVEDPEQSEGR